MDVEGVNALKRQHSFGESSGDETASVHSFFSPSGPSTRQSTQRKLTKNGGRGVKKSRPSVPTRIRKSKPNKPSKSTISTAGLNEVVDAVADGSSQAAAQTDIIGSLKSEVCDLRNTIAQQSATIAKLHHQLQSVMSYLELTDDKLNTPPTSSSSSSSAGSAAAGPAGGATVAPSAPSTSLSSSSAGQGEWTTVHHHKSANKRPTAAAAAVVAVYAEEAERKRRASSVVVTGLPPSSSTPDKRLFADLCHTQLGVDMDITNTKRLGQVIPGKIQPLLVALRDQQMTQQLLGVVRNLRKSTDKYVRDRIYVNPNRTRAEAEAAYQQRVQRRQTAARKSSSTTMNAQPSGSSSSSSSVLPVPPSSLSSSVLPAPVQPSASSAAAAAPPPAVVVTAGTLNATAAAFTPSNGSE